MDPLAVIASLSREFGTEDYVRGGGGNTSVKNDTTLWVKPSGTQLASMRPETFVAMDRRKLEALFAAVPPASPKERETFVREVMAKAVLPGSSGRASVEAPLHETLGAAFVVHTHPALVNGMTCARGGREACRSLFPEALWIDYTDPGYTLCMKAREEIAAYTERRGREPELIFLGNHGIFVAADTPERVRASYRRVFEVLAGVYAEKGILPVLGDAPVPDEKTAKVAAAELASAFGGEACETAVSGGFEIPAGPISPDHIVYAKSYPLAEKPTAAAVGAFRERHGYLPRVVASGGIVIGAGPTKKAACLALEFAKDGALVAKLARAFGGIGYLDDRSRKFIETWEAESYRSRQMEGGRT